MRRNALTWREGKNVIKMLNFVSFLFYDQLNLNVVELCRFIKYFTFHAFKDSKKVSNFTDFLIPVDAEA